MKNRILLSYHIRVNFDFVLTFKPCMVFIFTEMFGLCRIGLKKKIVEYGLIKNAFAKGKNTLIKNIFALPITNS